MFGRPAKPQISVTHSGSSILLAATMAPATMAPGAQTRRKTKSADDAGGATKRQRATSSALVIPDSAPGGVNGKVYAQVQQAWANIEGHEVFHDITNMEPLPITLSGDSGTQVPTYHSVNTFKMV